MSAAFLPDEPDSARTCKVCGVGGGMLGQYLDLDDKLVWAHLGCARQREYEPVDGGIVSDTYGDE